MSFTAPDWRVESNYADPKNETNLSFWAWEFLRRSPAYKASWAEYVASLRQLAQRLPDLESYINHIVDGTEALASDEQSEKFHQQADDALELIHFSPTRQADESFDDWSRRAALAGGAARCTPLGIHLAEKYNLDRLVNPALGYWANGFPRAQFKNSGLRVKQMAPGGPLLSRITFSEFLSGTRLTIEFDLNSPDTVLLAQLKAALKTQRRRIKNKAETAMKVARPKGSLALFRTYLRVLDATDAGCKASEIAAEIEPHKDKEQQVDDIANWVRRATELRDVQCIELPAYAEISVKGK
jgi:hypothetical protein